MLKPRARGILLATATAAGLLACAGNRGGDTIDPSMPTMLSVENQGLYDMRIYVLRNSQRIRLGTANLGQTTTFKLPRSILAGMTSIRVIADPISGRGVSVSEEITIMPGEEIVMRILP